MDLALKPARWPFSFEKWYIDTLMPDGSVLLVYLGRLNLLGVSMAQVTADLFRPGQRPLRGQASASKIHGEGDRLHFGPATIDGERLCFSTAGLSGELTFRALHPPAILGDPFIEEAGRRLDWTVEIPDAEVQGELSWPGGTMAVSGRGYRDRVWLDMAPWRFPITELTWGRAAAGTQASTWVQAKTSAGAVSRCWLNGEVVDGTSKPVQLSEPRVLLDSAIYDLDSLHLGVLRPLLRRWYGDPWQTKWAAAASMGQEHGVAIHEVVRWHDGKAQEARRTGRSESRARSSSTRARSSNVSGRRTSRACAPSSSTTPGLGPPKLVEVEVK